MDDPVHFFADLTRKPTSTELNGVRVTTWYGTLTRDAVFRFSPAHMLPELEGIFVRAWLPTPLHLDLHLESPEELPEGDSAPADPDEDLRRRFRWSATSDDLVLQHLRGKPAEVLRRLSRRHLVYMNDEGVTFGPINETPETSAELLTELIEMVRGLSG
jgi:hypothetical protein